MNDRQALKEAMEKAEENGYVEYSWGDVINGTHASEIIFSHDFAKAFFGDGEIFLVKTFPSFPEDKIEDRLVKWQYHLQQMVLEVNPADYLCKFMEDITRKKHNRQF